MIELMNWKMCKSSFLIIYLQYFKAYFRNAAKDAKKEINESNLKFCLNALIQLLDKWGGEFFSWDTIFDDEEDKNVKIDFGKYIKNEDVIEYLMEGLSSSDFLEFLSTDIENDISKNNSIQADNELEDAIELIILDFEIFKPDFNNFSSAISFLIRLLDNPTYAKIIEKLLVNPSGIFKSALQYCQRNYDFERISRIFENSGLNTSRLFRFLFFLTNNKDCMKIFELGADHVNMAKQVNKTYVFNTIFEIIATEGPVKIFKYTFSEAVKIMRSSEIILIKKQIN